MFQIDDLKIDNALLLAPMEDVTDIGYRKLCKELGADVVYTEFVNSDGLIRNNKKTHNKLKITEEERPVGIQIYGGDLNAMVEAAKIANAHNFIMEMENGYETKSMMNNRNKIVCCVCQ